MAGRKDGDGAKTYVISGKTYTIKSLCKKVGISNDAMRCRVNKYYHTDREYLIMQKTIPRRNYESVAVGQKHEPEFNEQCDFHCSSCKFTYCNAEHIKESKNEEKKTRMRNHYGFIRIDDVPYRRHHWGEHTGKKQ